MKTTRYALIFRCTINPLYRQGKIDALIGLEGSKSDG